METWHWFALFAAFYVATGLAYYALLGMIDGIGPELRGGKKYHAVRWPLSALGLL
jgi:hypothetical protein